MKKLLWILAVISMMFMISCGSGGGGGSSSSGNTTEKSGIQGTWGNGVSSVTFMADNTYAVDTNQNDVADAWGTYSTTGNQLTMTDGGGTSSCFDTASQTFDTGHYTYSISGNSLTLTLVSDNCSGRVSTLTDDSWTGQSSSDTSAPSVPINLTATAATISQINLNWSASSDNTGVAGYKVFRNGALVTTTLATVFSDTGLASNTTYTYTVSAYDAAGNTSGQSASANATTSTSSTTKPIFSGYVSGDVMSGVTITVTGTDSATATTNSSGYYYFYDNDNGSYTITPSKTGYTFSPTSRTITINNADVTGLNFTATANTTPTYSITGTVSGAVASGVTITLSGASSSSTSTNTSGNFSFTGLSNDSYTITPSKSGYTFSPTSRNVTVNGANITGVNFTGTAITSSGCSDKIGNWAGTMTGHDICGKPYTGTSTMVVNADCSGSMWTIYSHGNPGGGSFVVSGNTIYIDSMPCDGCDNPDGIPSSDGYATFSGSFSGNSISRSTVH